MCCSDLVNSVLDDLLLPYTDLATCHRLNFILWLIVVMLSDFYLS
jgi:hypothetical protein